MSGSDERLRSVARTIFTAAMRPRRPKLSGRLVLPGVERRVTILRDGFGIPHIRAESDTDAFFGLGFCHGQDRGGQLELSLRAVRGILSEVAGVEGLPLDRLSRRIGFKRVAAAQLRTMQPEVVAQLDAYARGVTAGMTTGMDRKAYELTLLGCEPTPWTASDVQAVSVLLCFALAANWDVELLRLEMLEKDGPDAVLSLDAPYPDDLPTSMPGNGEDRLRAVLALRADLDRLAEVFPLAGASNAWALSPTRTLTKRPLLAADPHLPPDAPTHWYLAHLATPSWRASGASFVGVAGIGIGHSDFAAWGVTAAHADNTDLFLEDVQPDGVSVRGPEGVEPCLVIDEVISIKGRPPIVERVLVTPRGPIVSPALQGTAAALSLAATWLSSRPYTGLYRAHLARDQRAFFELFREASTSSVNVVYADRDGHIGWRLGVEIPIRRGGHGTLPQPGWAPDRGFTGALVPFEAMPELIDPPEGFIVSANNAPTPPTTRGPFFGFDFLDGYRQRVLCEALAQGTFGLEDMAALQRNTRSIPWEELRATVLAAKPETKDAALAHSILEAWDGTMSRDAIGATVWTLVSTSLIGRIVRAKAPKTADRALGLGFHRDLPVTTMITRRMSHFVRLVREQPAGFLPEGFPRAIASAFDLAVKTLRSHLGEFGPRWAWGEARPLRMHHPMGKTVRALDYVFAPGPLPFAGDATTVMQASVDLSSPLSSPLAVPSLRVVIDVGEWERSRFALISGQSANPESSHHFDQWEAWHAGGVPIAWTEEAARASAHHVLELERGS
jgi:penicillin G amidase